MPTIVLYKNIYSSFIHTSQKLEIIQISINKRSEKDLIVYSYNRTLFSNEKKQTWFTQLRRWILKTKHNTEWKKLDTKRYILYDSSYMKFKKKQNCSVLIESLRCDWKWGNWLESVIREFLGWWKCLVWWLGCMLHEYIHSLIHALNSHAFHSR